MEDKCFAYSSALPWVSIVTPCFFPLSLTLNEHLFLYSCSVNALAHGVRSCFGFCFSF